MSRRQFPLTTGDCATITSVQGETCDAIIIDLEDKGHLDAVELYVALTRAGRSIDILLLKPFRRNCFKEV